MSAEPSIATVIQTGRLAIVALARLDGREDVAYPMVGDHVSPEVYMSVVDALNILASQPAMTDEEWRTHLTGLADRAAFVETALRFAADPLGVPDGT